MSSKPIKSFAQVGEIFDDATARLLGGVSNKNADAISRDLTQVQDGITKLLASDPGAFQGTSAIHAQNIVDQINLEKSAIASIGTDPASAKYINDVQRDLIDIVQGDTVLSALATHNGHMGFEPVPDLLVPPTPFVGNAQQTAFMQGFAATTQDFAARAVTLADHHGSAAEIQQLVGEVQTYDTQADAFTRAQGGVYSARFNNEFASDGVNGTASRALIDGLQTGNAGQVHAAADVLLANAQDVMGNMLPSGSTPPTNGNGIPASVQSVAEAGTIFNDATTKLIGGVFDGNRQSIHDDLTATQQGLSSVLAGNTLKAHAEKDLSRVVDLIGKELQVVDGGGTSAHDAAQIQKLHTSIIDIVQHDPALATAASADGAMGFMQLPASSKSYGNGPVASSGGPAPGSDAGHGVFGQAPDPAAGAPDHLAQIFDHATYQHHG